MSNIVLSTKAAKFIRVCEVEGFATIDDLFVLLVADNLCPAICMTEGGRPHCPFGVRPRRRLLRNAQRQHHGLRARLS